MKKARSKNKSNPEYTHVTILVSSHVLDVLKDFQERYMPDGNNNAANAACYILHTALMDYDHLMARAIQVIQYCNAEGIVSQQEYQESVLRMKFPRGRVPRKIARKS